VDLAFDLVLIGLGAAEHAHHLDGHGELAAGELLVPQGLLELADAAAAVGNKADVQGEGAVQLDLAVLLQFIDQVNFLYSLGNQGCICHRKYPSFLG
jgi:hypothetical protein